MNCQAKIGNLVFNIDFSGQKDLIKELSSLQEIFGYTNCGACKSTDLRYVLRENKKKNKYYELKCKKCHAKLTFGQHQESNTLFPKLKDENGNFLPDNGWVKYEKANEDNQ